MIRSLLTVSCATLFLLGCTSTEEVDEVPEQEPVVAEPPAPPPEPVDPAAEAEARQRLIADVLFEGLQALDANRLLTPIDDSAHARFARVLAYEPDNAIALQGMQDIVVRYLDLARDAIGKGLFNDAELMLERAIFVDDEHPGIQELQEALAVGISDDDMFFQLDYRELANRSEQAQLRLAEIAQQARQLGAFFLITAPNDELARWMFSVMRESVDGYRLRGNIELTSRTSIRLRVPSD